MITLPKLLGLSLLGGSMWTGAILPVVLTPARQDAPPAASKTTQSTQPAADHPNDDASDKYHGVTAPKLISAAPPEYSEEARERHVSGDCIVGLIVNADGTPRDVHVTKSIAEGAKEKNRAAALTLDEMAIQAVQQYRFEPSTYRGKPVPVEVRVTVKFRMR